MTEPANHVADHDKRVVRLLAGNLRPRDLSIALVGLRQYALLDADVAARNAIHLHQWQKDYARRGVAGTIDGLDVARLVDSLDVEHTDVFGFSTYIWNMEFMLALAAEIKRRNSRAVTLFGGSQAGGYGSRFLEEFPQADFVIRGEAEYSFRAFLHALDDGLRCGSQPLLPRRRARRDDSRRRPQARPQAKLRAVARGAPLSLP